MSAKENKTYVIMKVPALYYSIRSLGDNKQLEISYSSNDNSLDNRLCSAKLVVSIRLDRWIKHGSW